VIFTGRSVIKEPLYRDVQNLLSIRAIMSSVAQGRSLKVGPTLPLEKKYFILI